MATREFIKCSFCRKTVATDEVHSCYDFDAVERLRSAERAVIDAAKAYVKAVEDHRAIRKSKGRNVAEAITAITDTRAELMTAVHKLEECTDA